MHLSPVPPGSGAGRGRERPKGRVVPSPVPPPTPPPPPCMCLTLRPWGLSLPGSTHDTPGPSPAGVGWASWRAASRSHPASSGAASTVRDLTLASPSAWVLGPCCTWAGGPVVTCRPTPHALSPGDTHRRAGLQAHVDALLQAATLLRRRLAVPQLGAQQAQAGPHRPAGRGGAGGHPWTAQPPGSCRAPLLSQPRLLPRGTRSCSGATRAGPLGRLPGCPSPLPADRAGGPGLRSQAPWVAGPPCEWDRGLSLCTGKRGLWRLCLSGRGPRRVRGAAARPRGARCGSENAVHWPLHAGGLPSGKPAPRLRLPAPGGPLLLVSGAPRASSSALSSGSPGGGSACSHTWPRDAGHPASCLGPSAHTSAGPRAGGRVGGREPQVRGRQGRDLAAAPP